MSYHGDIALGATIDIKFTTRQSTGAPATLAGTPVISAYVGNGTTEITAGITLTTDFDARTGLNNVRVVATSGNGFATATDVDLVITTGTVNSVSVVGEVIGSFSIEHRAGLSPTATANLQTAFDDTAGPVPWLGIVDQGTAQAASGTTVTIRAASAFGTNTLGGSVIGVLGSDQGYWQFAGILSNVTATDVVTLDSTIVTPTGTITYKIFGGPLAPTLTPTVDVTKWLGSAPNALIAGRVDSSSGAMASGVITATSIAADAITDDKVASDVTIASVTGAVGSVTGAVGSVTGLTASDVAAIKAKTDNLPASPASTTNITAGTITTVTNLTNAPTSGDLTATMKASVNAEVVDALNVDTYAEPGQGAPAATTSLAAKLNYLFKAWRNKSTQTSTTYSLYDDAGTTVDQKSTVSDDATTFTKGEIVTGP